MSFKYDKKRRLFLSDLAKGAGLLSVSSLFSLNTFAQSTSDIQNVVFFFFNHTANFPQNDNRGTFHLDSGSGMPNLVKHKDDALFVRNCDHKFRSGTGNTHSTNQYSIFTGYNTPNNGHIAGTAHDSNAGVSMDLVAGNFLQKKYRKTGDYHPFEIEKPKIKNLEVKIRPTYIEKSGRYPMNSVIQVPVTAVFGDTGKGHYECHLPAFDLYFYYYEPRHFKSIFNHLNPLLCRGKSEKKRNTPKKN